jgi:hypothetical protein
MAEWRDIRLPEELCAEAERLYANRFANVADLLTFVLQELNGQDAAQLDLAEQRIIEERLKELGYI